VNIIVEIHHLAGELVASCTMNLIIRVEKRMMPARLPNFAINSARTFNFN